LQGEVGVALTIEGDGKVSSATASGDEKLLRDAAEADVRQWIFCSAVATAESENRHLTIRYVYKLEGADEYYDPPAKVVFDLPGRIEITSHPYQGQPYLTPPYH
jgi:hypothetical protein